MGRTASEHPGPGAERLPVSGNRRLPGNPPAPGPRPGKHDEGSRHSDERVFRFGIEHETALLRTDGSFADFSNTTFDELQCVVDRLPEHAADYPPLYVDELGIKRKRWYVEGFERFSSQGRYLGSDAKGIETRTVVHATIASAMRSLREDFAALAGESRACGFLPVPVSFNPFRSAFEPRPPLNGWEQEHRYTSPERRTAVMHMATYGPDLNLSVAGMTDDEAIDVARRLTFLSPYIVPFSFSSPFADGALWRGLSRRTHGRTGLRPAVLVFLRDRGRLLPSDPSLTVPARLPAEAGRIEFKAFDTCLDLDLYGSLLALLKGLVLDRRVAGRRTTPDARLHQRASLGGFDDPEIRIGAAAALDAAERALGQDPDREHLGPLWAMLHARITPAHMIISAYRQGGPIGEVLRDVGQAAGYGTVGAPAAGIDGGCRLAPWRRISRARRAPGGPLPAGSLSSGALRDVGSLSSGALREALGRGRSLRARRVLPELRDLAIAGGRGEPLRPAVAVRGGEDACTPAEQDALTALRAAHPHLAAGFAPALRQARAVGLGKLWSALAREQLGGITVAEEEGHATLLLPDGTGVRGPRRLTELFAEHPPGLSVTLGGGGQRAIDHPVALLDAVIRSRREGTCPAPWQQLSDEVAASVANHALALVGESWRRERLGGPGSPNAMAWARRRSKASMGFSPLAVFEQAVVDGHPLHPCARIRGGMTPGELLAYAPEWADEIALGVVAVEATAYREVRLGGRGMRCLVQRWHPSAAGAAAAHLRSIGQDPDRYELLPVHPWQLRHTVAQRYEAALGDLRIVPVPQAAIAARPLLSLRTFAAGADRRGPHWKTSLDVRLTTAVRIVSPEAARNGPAITGVVAEICRREQGFGGRFLALAELASGSYRPSADDPPGAAASLAVIARDAPERHVGAGEVALPGAALAARSPLTGRPLLADVLDEFDELKGRSPADAAASFLEAYCACSLPPLLTLLSGWGIALEPHGENVVVVLRRGLPVRVLYRDFGGIRISRSRLAHRGVTPPPLCGAVPTEDEDELRAKCLFPLLVTNLGQVVAALACVGGCDAGRLWEVVARRCRGAYAELKREAAIRAQAQRDEEALFGPALPVKSMLRVQLSATPHVPQWVAVPNPLR